MLPELRTHLEDRYGEDMDRLRLTGWAGCPDASARDQFDDLSLYVVARLASQPVGMVRLTWGDTSVLRHWSGGLAPLPTSHEVIEITQGVVDYEHRHRGLFRLLMLEALLWAQRLGATTATTAIASDSVARQFLHDLGFRDVGPPVALRHTPSDVPRAQWAVVTVSAENATNWRAMWETHTASVTAQTWQVRSALDAAG